MAPREVDVVVIGAGAGGLAAAVTARELGRDVLVLEAKERIGGRAHTDTTTFGVPWDRGAQWLHAADRNPLRPYAEAEGFAVERAAAPMRLWTGGRFDAALHDEARRYYADAFAAVDAAGARGLDVAASDVVPPHPRFRAMFDSWFAAVCGVEPELASTLDVFRYDDDGGNYRIGAGYGTLIAHYGRAVPVALGTPALRIDWSGSGVVVRTPTGDVRASAAIVTVSTAVLAAARIAFDPPLPVARQEAIRGLPLGEANKVALAFARNVFDMDEASHLHFEHDALEAIRFEIRPFGRDLAIGYLGGRFAGELEAAGPDAMADFALERLAAAFGTGIKAHLRGVASTGWSGDPDIGGGYSCARPGCADLRAVLAEPLAERVFFAGEACSITGFGAVHGAYESGLVAGRAAARAVRARG